MAFPTIPTTGAGTLLNTGQADTSGTRTFPSLSSLTKSAGDLLIAICAVYQSSAAGGAVFSGWGGGFTEFTDQGGTTSNCSIGAAYKFSTGSETGTFTVTQAATVTGHAAMFLLAIPGAHATAPPEAGTIAHGTSSSADPGSFSPSWGSDDTLWISTAIFGETATAGSFTGWSASPTNYNTGVGPATTDVVGGIASGIAFRQNTAASEDVGTWSGDTSNARNSQLLIAVRPAPPLTVMDIMTGYARGVNPRAY